MAKTGLHIVPDGFSADGGWYTDSWSPDRVLWSVRVEAILRDEQTAFQHLKVVDTPSHGRVMVLDGAVQVASRDEASYHELIVHPGLCRPALAGRDDLRVLIIGGGDGGAAREALRHPGVAQVQLVDIDPGVTRAARELFPTVWRLPHGEGSLDLDPRLEVFHEDGVAFLEGGGEGYDLIVVDSTDPVGPGAVLYSDRFYGLIRDRLRPGGACAVQGGSWWYLPEVLRLAHGGLRRALGRAEAYQCWTDVYPGGLWNLVLATQGDDPREVDLARAGALEGCAWYDAEVHRAAFALPPNARAVLAETRA